MNAQRLREKTAIVTGAARGIGRASAERLGREGARIALLDIDADGVLTTTADLRGEGLEADAYVCDVSTEDSVNAAVTAVAERLGRVDVLHANAGIFHATSKAAVNHMARQLALDYAASGIRVNAVCPGWVDTHFGDVLALSEAEIEEGVRATVPMGRRAAPEEVAAVVAFLASDEASYITGHCLV
ncbi:MAG: SDR family NAD(P)-dependent oxidoreductase, partial [Acidimicrobiia bacterium]